VGMALWDDNGKLLELKHLELKVDKTIPEEDRYIYKAELFKTYISDFENRIRHEYGAIIENIFVEAPLSNTPVNINTTAKLLAFNGIACYVLYEKFKITPYLISVHQTRKLFCPELVNISKKRNGVIKETLSFPKNVDKKLYVWEKVSKIEPDIEWFYTRNSTLKNGSFDMSDAYAVGVAGLITLDVLSHDEWINNPINKLT